MRNVLGRVLKEQPVEHAGLAYEVWAPVNNETGKVPDDQRGNWLADIETISVPEDYSHAYALWRDSFTQDGSRLLEMKLASRLLVGHGNPAPTGLGLTLHHTWGVPVIPGSALKGLLAHYVDAVYGPDQTGRSPVDPELDTEARARAQFQGVTWHERRVQYGPGEVYRNLFGAPDADVNSCDDRNMTSASRGLVEFHDAVYIPGRADDDRPLEADVLTVHQRSYQENGGKYQKLAEQQWPNDYDPPNPVTFLTVRPESRFLLALSGPAEWTELAMGLLRDALVEWGVGGKTSQGYGRARPDGFSKVAVSHRASEQLARFQAYLDDPGTREDGQPLFLRTLLDRIRSEWLGRLRGLAPTERKQAARAIQKQITSRKLKEQVARLIADLDG